MRKRTARPKTGAQLAEAYPLSVVIPARNVSSVLSVCLDSLLADTPEHVEILVVDDASTDSTAGVVREYAARHPIRLIELKDQRGPGEARNIGLQHCRSPHVLFLDADVLLPRRSLEWIRESLEVYQHRPEVVGVLGTYAENLPWKDFLSHYKNLYICYLYSTTETLSPFIHTAVFCVQKEILAGVGGFDSRFSTAEDFRLGVVLGSAGYRFVIDRRIRGIHLKRYRWLQILKEDLRRIRDLRRVAFTAAEKEFSYRAHRWGRLLSLMLPGPILFLLLVSLAVPAFLKSALLLLVVFLALNTGFWGLCLKTRGVWFAVRAMLVFFLEMLWGEFALLYSRMARVGPETSVESISDDSKGTPRVE